MTIIALCTTIIYTIIFCMIYLTHTEVPRELEGKGIGSQLVEKTLQDIERQGLRLVPLCPFVAAYIKKHPEWRRIVMKGINIK